MGKLLQRFFRHLNTASTVDWATGWLPQAFKAKLLTGAIAVGAFVLGLFQGMTPVGALLTSLIAGSVTLFAVNQWPRAASVVRGWIKHPDITIANAPYVETHFLRTEGGSNIGDDLVQVTFDLIVRNSRKDRKTLRDVTANVLHIFGPERPLRSRTGDGWRTDLRHGERAYFKLGYTIHNEIVGLPSLNRVAFMADEIETFEHNVRNGHRTFVAAPDASDPLRLGFQAGPYGAPTVIYVVVSADDVASASVRVTIDPRKLPHVGGAVAIEPLEGS